jgi:predicted Zn-ribbon and HTH transcriptional regulator
MARRRQINKTKEPTVPAERYETIRKYITALLEQETLSAKDLSQYMRIPQKDISDHLEHIRKTLNKNNQRLVIIPAQCEKCGFVYKKRDRFSKPGKCPVCRSSLIHPPLFHIEKTG